MSHSQPRQNTKKLINSLGENKTDPGEEVKNIGEHDF